jgi:primosomal protein N' (replication factor Y) (superfamily II helicase)
MERRTIFADVILPLALPRLFTYRVPVLLAPYIKELQRVIVPFGKQKRYTAIIRHLHENPPKGYEARYIDEILEFEPGLNPRQLQFWEWMSQYYMCSLGEVMQAALPAGLKLSSETVFRPVNLLENVDASALSDREYLILEALHVAKELKVKDVESIAGIKTVYPIIRGMMEKKLIVATEELKEVFKQRTEVVIKLSEEFYGEALLHSLLNSLNRAGRQQELVLAYLSMFPGKTANWEAIKRKELLKKAGSTSPAALAQLIKKGIFISEEIEVSRLSGDANAIYQDIQLSEAQKNALEQIQESFAEGRPALLFGVTGSGKTEIYLELIREQLENGKQVLYLLPEIALTAQIIQRLRVSFGRKVQVYHSKFSEQERVEVYQAVSEADPEAGMIVLGARSSVFLPFKNLGLVIVDEEHESTFKQFEPTPRYHARDSALVLGKQNKADVLLGSATPSMESFYNAKQGKYTLVRLSERFGGSVLPQIEISDLRVDTKKRKMKGLFSAVLVDDIAESLKNEQQVILFQNRRGFAPMIECQNCHWVPHCVQCDISLTYHKAIHQLRCHYCGYSMNVPPKCAECGSPDMRMKGFGTEKIEEELAELFPEVSSARMDLDTTRSKFAYHRIIEDFEQQRTQVLIGTQMVSKGLDFDRVHLVAVLSADSMLNFPDFRAFERSYQLISQVAGRAGRRETEGKVLIQTWKPDHDILKRIQEHDYDGFFATELEERRQYHYPPFTRLIHITLKHESMQQLDPAADMLANFLRHTFGPRILGPEYPPVSRVRNLFQKRLLMKIEAEASLIKIKVALQEQIDLFFKQHPLKNFRLVIDVDPM